MSKSNPIVTNERKPLGYREEMREWTYDEILNLFDSDDGNLVRPLVHRCMEYEAEIERLRKALNTCQSLARGDKHTTYLDRCVAIDMHVHFVLRANGGDDE